MSREEPVCQLAATVPAAYHAKGQPPFGTVCGLCWTIAINHCPCWFYFWWLVNYHARVGPNHQRRWKCTLCNPGKPCLLSSPKETHSQTTYGRIKGKLAGSLHCHQQKRGRPDFVWQWLRWKGKRSQMPSLQHEVTAQLNRWALHK